MEGREASKLDTEAEARGLEKHRKGLHDTVPPTPTPTPQKLRQDRVGRRRESSKASSTSKTSSHVRAKSSPVDLATRDLRRGVSVEWWGQKAGGKGQGNSER